MTRQGMRLARVPEKDEQSAIVQLLRSLGAAVYVIGHPSPNDGRSNHGTGQTAGIPDLYALLPTPRYGSGSACAVWIEVKATGGYLRVEQRLFRDRCTAVGQLHIVGGVDAVMRWLTKGGWLRRDAICVKSA